LSVVLAGVFDGEWVAVELDEDAAGCVA